MSYRSFTKARPRKEPETRGQGFLAHTWGPVVYSPKCVDIGSFGEGQLVLVPPWYHFSYDLGGQVAQPVMRQFQLVLTPGGQDKDTGPSEGSGWPDYTHLLLTYIYGMQKAERGVWMSCLRIRWVCLGREATVGNGREPLVTGSESSLGERLVCLYLGWLQMSHLPAPWPASRP